MTSDVAISSRKEPEMIWVKDDASTWNDEKWVSELESGLPDKYIQVVKPKRYTGKDYFSGLPVDIKREIIDLLTGEIVSDIGPIIQLQLQDERKSKNAMHANSTKMQVTKTTERPMHWWDRTTSINDFLTKLSVHRASKQFEWMLPYLIRGLPFEMTSKNTLDYFKIKGEPIFKHVEEIVTSFGPTRSNRASVFKTLSTMPEVQNITFSNVKFCQGASGALPYDAKYVFGHFLGTFDRIARKKAKAFGTHRKIDRVKVAEAVRFVAATSDPALETAVKDLNDEVTSLVVAKLGELGL